MVPFGQSGCIRAKVIVLGQNRGFLRAELIVFGHEVACIRAKIVVFEAKWLYSEQKCLYSGKGGSI